jgi:hypothetical protein
MVGLTVVTVVGVVGVVGVPAGVVMVVEVLATAGDVCQVEKLLVEQEVEGKDPAILSPVEWKKRCRPPSRPAKYRLPIHWRRVYSRGSTPPRSPCRYGLPENAQTGTPSSASTSALSRPEICSLNNVRPVTIVARIQLVDDPLEAAAGLAYSCFV